MEDVAGMDWRLWSNEGWLSSSDVSMLIELGHVEAVERLSVRGDWFCARGLADLHRSRAQYDAAIEALRPFADTGWWTAIESVAELLAEAGRIDEAVDLCVPNVANGERNAIGYYANVLAGTGRAEEAFDLLLPHIDDWWHARALMRIGVELGREEALAPLLEESLERLRSPGAEVPGVTFHIEILAELLEAQGRLDRAIAVLRSDLYSSNIVEHLASLLIRHHRFDELRELLISRPDAREIWHIVESLPANSDIDRVAAAIRAMPEPAACHATYHPSAALGQLLIRAGRTTEGVVELRKALDPDDLVSLHFFWMLLVEYGCVDEALSLIDDCAVLTGAMTPDLLDERVSVLAAAGRTIEAIEELRSRPAAQQSADATYLSQLLVSVGRIDAAVEVLEPGFRAGNHIDDMARLMIRQGRVAEGLELLCRAER
ncbi:hypothetical protein [Nocardia sp. NPDC057668]|uniref:hypothetical protein n=1 Tax=Nocardia sp. NPDC057668 TaxID=3346202 RepID=UPI0036709446